MTLACGRARFVVLALLGLVACQSVLDVVEPIDPPARQDPAPTQVQLAAKRAAQREVKLLRKLLVLDRSLVESAEQQAASVRFLFEMGRVARVELEEAEADLRRAQQALTRRQAELERAQMAAGR